jgi:seryl-tRNA synthetase
LPNLLDKSVPFGESEHDNKEIRRSDNIEVLKQKIVIPHHELLDDFFLKQAVNMSSSRFILLGGKISALYRAIASFCIDHLINIGFTEFKVPLLLNKNSFKKSGHSPSFDENIFWTEDFGLIPTAEAPLCNLFSDNTNKPFFLKELPLKLCSHTPCFRKEAGSAGKDTKGLIRLHQFEKVEMFYVSDKNRSYDFLEKIVNTAEELLNLLELPHRVILLCSKDTGNSSSKTYDIEVFLPSRGDFCEISSCSNCTDFQSRRSRIFYEYLDDMGTIKKEFVHLLNGSGLPIERTLATILEVHQTDGIVNVPKVLHKYINFTKITQEDFLCYKNLRRN